MKHLFILITLIVGAVLFLQSIWWLIDRGYSLKQIAAFVVLYSMIELWLHKKGNL